MGNCKHRVEVSPEMLSFVGEGPLPAGDRPARAVAFCFSGPASAAPKLTIDRLRESGHEASALVLVVANGAIERLFGSVEFGEWHLPAALRAMVLAILDPDAPGRAGDTLRLARSIELLCAVFDQVAREALVPTDGEGALSEGDAVRIVAARRLIDERWSEKLTLDAIARACGLNRGKLTRGFRALYACTVADALTERRLTGAQRMLEATDLPVATIGYRCGYLNNASFTRAFARHVGVAPTRWRAAKSLAA
jgi:AraC family transcriptional activator of pyochelin receptor